MENKDKVFKCRRGGTSCHEMINGEWNQWSFTLPTKIDYRINNDERIIIKFYAKEIELKVGDIIVVGNTYGKIRAMSDETGRQLKQAGPSKPVEITGINDVPFAGENNETLYSALIDQA